MTGGRLNWNRVGHVEIENSAKKMVKYNGLDFKFKVKSCGDIYNEFSVSVLGLSADTINDLTVWSPVKAIERPRLINVYAGYEETGEELVASGYVWYAIPTTPPEMWMTFQCRKYINFEESVSDPRQIKGTYKSIFSEVCSELGIRSNFMATDSKSDKNKFAIEGKRALLIDRFSDMSGKFVYENAGVIICTDTNGEQRGASRSVEINSDTGLLSIGNVDISGARIATRLRSDIGLADWISLRSRLVPSANGNYYVIEKELSGHLRGDEWKSEFRCLREII